MYIMKEQCENCKKMKYKTVEKKAYAACYSVTVSYM